MQAGCVRTPQPAIARAAGYLWGVQAGDGGWHSRTYGLLRSGQSLTPFVLDALLEVPEEVHPRSRVNVARAIGLKLANLRKSVRSTHAGKIEYIRLGKCGRSERGCVPHIR